MNDETITDILISHFGTDKTLQEIRQDYEDLELIIERERSANGEGSRRLEALNILAGFQLEILLRKMAETPDKGGESTVKTT
jgi:hypothetical protein